MSETTTVFLVDCTIDSTNTIQSYFKKTESNPTRLKSDKFSDYFLNSISHPTNFESIQDRWLKITFENIPQEDIENISDFLVYATKSVIYFFHYDDEESRALYKYNGKEKPKEIQLGSIEESSCPLDRFLSCEIETTSLSKIKLIKAHTLSKVSALKPEPDTFPSWTIIKAFILDIEALEDSSFDSKKGQLKYLENQFTCATNNSDPLEHFTASTLLKLIFCIHKPQIEWLNILVHEDLDRVRHAKGILFKYLSKQEFEEKTPNLLQGKEIELCKVLCDFDLQQHSDMSDDQWARYIDKAANLYINSLYFAVSKDLSSENIRWIGKDYLPLLLNKGIFESRHLGDLAQAILKIMSEPSIASSTTVNRSNEIYKVMTSNEVSIENRELFKSLYCMTEKEYRRWRFKLTNRKKKPKLPC